MMIDGEEISSNEEADLRRMIEHDCKEFAAEFFGSDGVNFGRMGRSKKFRRSWNEVGRLLRKDPCDAFVNLKWKHFSGHVVAWYAHRIPNEPEDIQLRLYRASIILRALGESPEAQDVIQLEPGTKAFEGDAFENRNIAEIYGEHADPVDKTALGAHSVH
jgi:hypothetical protein